MFLGGWSNHHITLIEAMLGRGYHVVIVRQHNEHDGRLKQLPQTVAADVEVVYCDKTDDIASIASLYAKDESLHINAALKQASDCNHQALRYLLANGYNVFSLPQESFQLMGLKKFVNGAKWWWYLNHTFRKNIKGFGLTGLNAERCFKNVGVDKRRLFQFLYVTRRATTIHQFEKNERLRFIFVGAIDERKNIIPFVKYMMARDNQNFTFDIFGSWSLDADLAQLVKNVTNITYHGKKGYDEVRACMTGADYLVLPSLYDGWGAVATEGLQSGCRLILSQQSGCSIFTDCHPELGYTFNAYDMASLDKPMAEIFSKGPLTAEEHRGIAEWADTHISPETAAEYLDGVIQYYFSGASLPACPWMSLNS